jgi:hypothetical protein
MAELLAVVTLRKTILGSVCLHPDHDVAEAWQTEYFVGFFRPGQGHKEEGQVCNFGVVGRRPAGGCHLLDADNVEAEVHQPVRYVLCRGVEWQVAYHCLYWFF